MRARFSAEVWAHEGESAWFFVTLPLAVADEIEDQPVSARPGFGSRRVEVTVGGSTWQTSIFPDGKRGSFLLPMKKEIRRREAIDDGDTVTVELELL
jgi:hypothetical protein